MAVVGEGNTELLIVKEKLGCAALLIPFPYPFPFPFPNLFCAISREPEDARSYGVTSSESRKRFALAEFTQALRPVTMTM
jgi:hypothetical protein